MRTAISVLLLAFVVACSGNNGQQGAPNSPTPSSSDAAEHAVIQVGDVSCNPNVVHQGDAKDGVGIPWLHSAYPSGEIFAHLLYYQQGDPTYAAMPADQDTSPKIMWVFRGSSSVGPSMNLLMTKRGGGALPPQSFKAAGANSFQSPVNLPTAGCWDLRVQSGTATATFTVVAVTS